MYISLYRKLICNNITQNVRVYPLVYVNGSSITTTSVETDVVTHTSTINEGFILANGENIDNITLGLSANNGSNYTTFTNKTINTIDNSGTQFKIKFTFSGANDLIPKISEYLASYDMW